MNDASYANKSTATLVTEAATHVSTLVRSEMDLARAELDQKMRQAAVAVGLLVAAVVAAITALNVLTAAIVAGLTEAGMPAGWSALIVGLVLAIVAWLFVLKGMNDLKVSSIAPTRTAENVKRDTKAARGTHNVN